MAEFIKATAEQVELGKTLGETLREDWESEMDEDGQLTIGYSCHCSACGFHYRYAHSEVAKLT